MTDMIVDLEQWCLQRRKSLTDGLALMESGVMHTRERHNGQMIDTTANTIKSYERDIVELDRVLAQIKGDREAKA